VNDFGRRDRQLHMTRAGAAERITREDQIPGADLTGRRPTSHTGNAIERLGDPHVCRSGATLGWIQVGMSNTSSGNGFNWSCSSVANTSADRSRVVPCTRVPATSAHTARLASGSRPGPESLPRQSNSISHKEHIFRHVACHADFGYE
jgi:hypothetical protein